MAEIYQQHSETGSSENIQSAIAQAVELRALHAALLQGNSPGNPRFSAASPVSRFGLQFSAQDYPVFTPSYGDEPSREYQQILSENRDYAGSWRDYTLGGEDVDKTMLADYRTPNVSSRKGFQPGLMNLEGHVYPADDQNSMTDSCAKLSIPRASQEPDYSKSRRNSLGDMGSVSSCNKCRPAVISSESDGLAKNGRKSNIVVPVTDSQSSLHSHQRSMGLGFSWLLPRLKKKNKNEKAPVSPQMVKDLGVLSMEALKKELMEARENRDAALSEVAEVKSSIGELNQKLEYLETYCQELKKALRHAVQVKNSQPGKKLRVLGEHSVDGNARDLTPLSDEAMVEGFLQIVSEARLSVKQFCKTLVGQIEESDYTIVTNLDLLLEKYKLSLKSKHSKAVLYHIVAIINQSLYQDFENCVFKKNGAPKLLDRHQEGQAQFKLFVELRNLSWNEVLRKGTKYYSEEFGNFCDQKMSDIIATLGWTRPWPEQLLQAFFVAAKCIWLLHLLAFSFDPPLSILRVDENRLFEPGYMEDIFGEKQRLQGPARVRVMVMPGFYLHDTVLRCKVLCRYKLVV